METQPHTTVRTRTRFTRFVGVRIPHTQFDRLTLLAQERGQTWTDVILDALTHLDNLPTVQTGTARQ